MLESEPNIRLIQQEIVGLLVDNGAVEGVIAATGSLYRASRVILCPGTFMDAEVIIGESVCSSGPDQLAPSCGLGDALKALGLPTTRFKTGTPGRFHFRSLDTDVMELQHADAVPRPFSFDNEDDPSWQPLAENRATLRGRRRLRKTH